MGTGLELYDALRNGIRNLPPGSEFPVNAFESFDLRKLKPSDLVSRGYEEKIAEAISSALFQGNFGPLGKSMGIRLSVSHDSPRLLPEKSA